ncbi:MAG: 2-succinyl-5-enolpyruvyl-6-hydroxy-3-cyclohexene-1-carboxylate synthase [Chlamydiia bacterium]|nr:2-succinyl-5-enolpyruvyl-6-hydroxy-3-cyclohexene-1-carboxylate synthase [Chlamydiia bacterium]
MLHHDVAHFCIAPGSRSTPLTSSVAKNKNCSYTVHFDERSLAYYALGYAKAVKKPVAIIVTSGTATANLLPAIMEAYESMVPLIVLTADRPVELLHCGANQATNQINMFANFVRSSRSFQAIDPFTPMKAMQNQISYALQASRSPIGPVHLNFMFREPFLSDQDDHHQDSLEFLQKPVKKYVYPEKSIPASEYKTLIKELNRSDKVFIICGLDSMDSESFQKVCNLSEKLNAPIFCDILSNHHKASYQEDVVAHGSLIFKSTVLCTDHKPEIVIHFGGSFVSKHLYSFLSSSKPQQYVHVSPYEKTEDPFSLTTHEFLETTDSFCKTITSQLNEKQTSNFKEAWEKAESSAKAAKELALGSKDAEIHINEPWLFHYLSEVNLSNHNVFIANSMPIRDAHDFFHPMKGVHHIYGNRGVSGIDGNISTVIGIAKASKKPTFAIVGDLTFLHDMTALSLLGKNIPPVTILVINNNGGCIFRNLPIYKEKDIYEEFFETPHNLSFSAVEKLFNVNYTKAHTVRDASVAIHDAIESSSHSIIEMKVDATSSTEERAKIFDALKLKKAVLC